MTKVSAIKILNIRLEVINECIKNKKIKVDEKGKLIEESVYEYLKELEERRRIKPPQWIHRNEF
jgi:hypothetical protein